MRLLLPLSVIAGQKDLGNADGRDGVDCENDAVEKWEEMDMILGEKSGG